MWRADRHQHFGASIDDDRQRANLSSAIRLFVLGFYHSPIRGAETDRGWLRHELCNVKPPNRAGAGRWANASGFNRGLNRMLLTA
jgi:hypothetical protein